MARARNDMSPLSCMIVTLTFVMLSHVDGGATGSLLMVRSCEASIGLWMHTASRRPFLSVNLPHPLHYIPTPNTVRNPSSPSMIAASSLHSQRYVCGIHIPCVCVYFLKQSQKIRPVDALGHAALRPFRLHEYVRYTS